MKRPTDSNGYLNFEADPAVDEILNYGRKKAADARLTRRERAKKTKEREKAAKRSRVMYDLPEEITDRIAKLAEDYETSASQVAQLALRDFLALVETGVIDLREYRTPIRNPRYGYKLVWKNRNTSQ